MSLDTGDRGAATFEHDIDFEIVAVPIVKKVDRVREPARLPAQFLHHECLEQGAEAIALAGWRVSIDAEQRTGEPRVAHVELGRLDHPTQSGPVPRGQPVEEEDALQHRDIVVDRLPRHLERRRQIRDVEELGRVRRSQREQPRQGVQGVDAGDIPYVALNLCLDEIAVPGSAPRGSAPREGLRISAADDAVSKRRPESIGEPGAESPAKQRLDEARPLPEELALRERMQPQGAHAAGKRLGQVRDECRTLAEPVKTYRPAVRRSSRAALAASH